VRRRLLAFMGILVTGGFVAVLFFWGGYFGAPEESGVESAAKPDALMQRVGESAESFAARRQNEKPSVAAEEQNADIRNLQSAELLRLMENVRTRGPVQDVREILELNPASALDLLANYANDNSARVRQRANAMSAQLALEHGSQEQRRKIVDQLITALSDQASTVVQHAAQDLLQFERTDFTDSARSELVRLLQQPEPNPLVIRLVGLAGLDSEVGRLAELRDGETMSPSMLQSARYYGGVGWAATLARARLGSQADLDVAIERVRGEENSVLRVTDLLRQIAYTRQPDALELVREYLESSEQLPELKPGSGTPYSQYALDILAGEIANFPVAQDGAGTYSDEDIAAARAFMADRSNWVDALAD